MHAILDVIILCICVCLYAELRVHVRSRWNVLAHTIGMHFWRRAHFLGEQEEPCDPSGSTWPYACNAYLMERFKHLHRKHLNPLTPRINIQENESWKRRVFKARTPMCLDKGGRSFLKTSGQSDVKLARNTGCDHPVHMCVFIC